MTAGNQAPSDGDQPDSARGRAPGRRSAAGGGPARRPDARRPDGSQPAAAGEERLSYEQARDQLTEVVRLLEGGGLTLEQSLELWQQGERLAAICSDWLEGARARLAASAPGREPSGDPEAPF